MSDHRGPHAVVGMAAKIERAWKTAPDGVDSELVQEVATQAVREDRDPDDIWNDVTHRDLDDFTGGEDQ